MPQGYSIRDMAYDYAQLIKHIGYSEVRLWGVSMGGMIAQWIMIDNEKLVRSACLDVTTAVSTETVKTTVRYWMDLVKSKKYYELFHDTFVKTYSAQRIKNYRLLLPFLCRILKVENDTRFLIQAEACMNHDAKGYIGKTEIPCLVTGGDNDKVLGPGATEELGALLPKSTMIIYSGLGHGSFEEKKDHNKTVYDFFENSTANS